jgi:hypothetical protein
MSLTINEVGNRYGRLKVIAQAKKPRNSRSAFWLCRCDCGKEIVARGWDLRNGRYISCGCSLHDGHRRKHGDYGTRLYSIWNNMRHRCTDTYSKGFPHYGGRGISVCNDWNDYESFRCWALSNGYSENLTIDRIDVNGNYEPSNCRWISMKEQALNKRTNHFLECDGKRKTVKEWADEIGICQGTLFTRLRRGWSDEQIIKTPVANCGRRMMKK